MLYPGLHRNQCILTTLLVVTGTDPSTFQKCAQCYTVNGGASSETLVTVVVPVQRFFRITYCIFSLKYVLATPPQNFWRCV